MTKKGQKIKGVVLVLYFSSNVYYSRNNYLLENGSKQFELLTGKTNFSKKFAIEGDILVTST